jgi:TolB-like protein
MRRLMVVFVLAFSGLLLITGQGLVRGQQGTSDSAPRIWKTRTGSYSTKATLLKFEDGVVQLEKQDGKVVSLPIEKLSEADQEYVKSRASGAKPADPSPTKPSGGDETSEFLVKSQQLSEEIAKRYKGKETGGKAKIAVVEFSDLSGGVTEFGRLLSEELITKLSDAGSYTLVERLLLNKAIEEHKLQLQGLIDPKSAKELGKILGVDAIVSGTIADMGGSLRVNARLISTETGEVLCGAAVSIIKDDSIGGLMTGNGKSARTVPGGSSSSLHPEAQPVQLPFREDFSGYEIGDETDWGPGGKVRTGTDGRRWLVPSGNGQIAVGRDVRLPVNAYIEFDYEARQLESKDVGEKALSGISLVDETGARFRMEFVANVGNRSWDDKYELTAPGGTSITDRGISTNYGSAIHTIIIRRSGDKINARMKDDNWNRDGVTGDLSNLKRITRFELDLYKGPNSTISFTNIKITGEVNRDRLGNGPKPRSGKHR